MRVVMAPDSFGDLSADRVAEALASGWRAVAEADDVVTAPLSDGGPGFVAVLAASLATGRLERVDACGPTGEASLAQLLVDGATAYVESAMVCGLAELTALQADVRTATTYGVGQLVRAAAAVEPVDTVVVGLGGSGTNDGGAGLWAALGAEPADLLRGGGAALREVPTVRPPSPAVRLIAATDVDNPLLGLHGASAVYGPQKGADRAAVIELDHCLERWADAVETAVGRPGLRDEPGAGAAGGLGFGLLALGARLSSGVELVIELAGLEANIAGADLVVTGEGRYDATSLRGKVASGVARVAQDAGVPCVVAAGQAAIGAREAAAHGIDAVFTVTEITGSVEVALAAGLDGIRELGRAIAREWSR